jgi:NAD(P) transhydrogenase subunit alpha
MPESVLNNLYIFVLAMFTGFEVITKVPPLLHTPLMSGANAISGISVVGALLITAASTGDTLILALGVVAVAMGMINVAGGFLVTDRMLQMFKRKPTGEAGKS